MLKKVRVLKGSLAGQVIEEREDLLEPFIVSGIGEWYDGKDLKEVGETKELKEPQRRGRKAKN